VPPGQSQPPPAPWTPPPGQQPPTYSPTGGGTSIPPPPPAYGQQPGQPGWSGPTSQQPAWQSQPPGGPQGPWQSQPPPGAGGPKSKTPLILAGVGVLIVIAIIAAVLLSGGDDDKKDVASGSTTAPSSSTTAEETTTTTTEEETTTTTESGSSGVLEAPEPISGYQLYEDPAGEFAVTFPEDWTVGENSDVGGATTVLIASAPMVEGFSVNLNMLTVDGATDGEFDFDGFPQIQSDALANADGFENVSHEELTIGDKDGFVIQYTIDQAGSRADGYQFYVPGSDLIYILTVTVPEGGDRTVADNIGQSLRVA
jgi:hypothetical protein